MKKLLTWIHVVLTFGVMAGMTFSALTGSVYFFFFMWGGLVLLVYGCYCLEQRNESVFWQDIEQNGTRKNVS
jgi:hypothetical protein